MSKFKFSFVAFVIFPIPNSKKFENMALCEILKCDWKIPKNYQNHLMFSNLILLGPVRTTTKNGICHLQKIEKL